VTTKTDGKPPVLVGETCVVLHVLHFQDGTASSTFHVTAAGFGHLLNRPRTLADMLHEHANALAVRKGVVLPPEAAR
jgi:cytochrome b561